MGVYTVRIFKSVVGKPEVNWVNTYEITTLEDIDYAAGEAQVAVIIAAEAAIHLNIVQFDRATISTWAPDSQPYDPEALFTYSGSGILGQVGFTGTSSEVLDTVAWFKRIATSGRNGRLFFRGVLREDDTQEDAKKKPGLTPAGNTRLLGLVSTFNLAFSTSELGVAFVMVGRSQVNKVYPATPFGVKQIPQITYGPVHTRPVTTFALGGVTRSPMDHEYFDIGG